MNLKDWEALGKEGQRKYWERATLDQKRELVGLGLPPESIKTIADIEFSPTGIRSCCESVTWLKAQIEDEIKANHDYQLASEFTEGYPLADEIIHQIALDEARHRFLVEGLARELNNWCHCKEE